MTVSNDLSPGRCPVVGDVITMLTRGLSRCQRAVPGYWDVWLTGERLTEARLLVSKTGGPGGHAPRSPADHTAVAGGARWPVTSELWQPTVCGQCHVGLAGQWWRVGSVLLTTVYVCWWEWAGRLTSELPECEALALNRVTLSWGVFLQSTQKFINMSANMSELKYMFLRSCIWRKD